MSGPLDTGHSLARLDVNSWLSDPAVTVLNGQGRSFSSLKSAETHARAVSKGKQQDAVIVRDASGNFWVYATDEFSRRAGTPDKPGADAARRHLSQLTLPKGVELQSFMVSANDTEAGEKVLTLGVEDGKSAGRYYKYLRDTLARLDALKGQQLALRDGVTVRELVQLHKHLQEYERAHPIKNGLVTHVHAASHRVSDALKYMKKQGVETLSLKAVAYGRAGKQTDNRVEGFLARLKQLGAPAALLSSLRGSVSRQDLDAVEAFLHKVISQPRSQVGEDLDATARGLRKLVRQALGRISRAPGARLFLDQVADPQGPFLERPVKQDKLTFAATSVFRDFSGRHGRLAKALKMAAESLDKEVLTGYQKKTDTTSQEQFLKYLQGVRVTLRSGNYQRAFSLLRQMSAKVEHAIQANPIDGAGAVRLRAMRDQLLTELRALPKTVPVASVAGVRVQRLSQQFLEGTLSQSQIILNAVFSDPATLIDDALGTGRHDPHDVAMAMLRYNVSAWTVARDVRNGGIDPTALPPKGFGKEWSKVTTADIRKLAHARFKGGKIKYDVEARAMRRDPLWREKGLAMPTPEGKKELRLSNINSWSGRSFSSLLSTQGRAVAFVGNRMMQIGLSGAQKVSGSSPVAKPATIAQVSINTVHAMFYGPKGYQLGVTERLMLTATPFTLPLALAMRRSNLPPHASQVQKVLLESTNTSPIAPPHGPLLTKREADALTTKRLPSGQPKYVAVPHPSGKFVAVEIFSDEAAAQRAARVKDTSGQSQHLPFKRPDGTYTLVRLKTTTEIASEILAKADNKELGHLDAKSLGQIRELLAGKPPGQLLAARMQSEDNSKFWREFGSEVVKIAVIGAISGGVGAYAGGALAVARFSHTAVRLGQLVANSVTFTTLMGATTGQLSGRAYATDLAMFGVLAKLGKLTALFKHAKGAGLKVNVGRFLARHGVAVGGSASVMHGVQVIDAMVDGRELPGWKEFGHTLMMVSVLHTVNQNVGQLAPKSARRIEISERLAAVNKEMKALLAAVKSGNKNDVRTSVARLNEHSRTIEVLLQGLRTQAKSSGSDATQKLFRVLSTADARYANVNHLHRSALQLRMKWAGRPEKSRTAAEKKEYDADRARYAEDLRKLPKDIRRTLGEGDPFGIIVSKAKADYVKQAESRGLSPEQADLSYEVSKLNPPDTKPLSQTAKTLDQLIADARVAKVSLVKLTKKVANRTGGVAGLRPKAINDGIKGRDNIDKKMRKDSSTPSNIVDVAASKIIYDNIDLLYAGLRQINQTPGMKIVRIKDRIAKPQESGYRDILLNVRMPNRHIVEIRLHLRPIDKVYATEHTLYKQRQAITQRAHEQNRPLSKEEVAEYDSLLQKSQQLYESVWIEQVRINGGGQ